MRVNQKLVFILVLVFALSGCGKSSNPSESSSATVQNLTPAASGEDIAKSIYPIKTNEALTIFSTYPRAQKSHEKYQDTPFAKYLAEKTGVSVEYTFVTAEQFSVLIASRQLPDLMEYAFTGYPGGPSKAIKDKVIIPLNGLNAFTPNLNAVLKDHPEWDKQVKTDEGQYFTFPFFRGDDKLRTFQGPIIRKDWLDELKLQPPETLDEYEAVLQAFKDKKGAISPLSTINLAITIRMFCGAFHIGENYYLDNGEIKYAPYTREYKEMLAKLNDWYKKGLIDKDFGAINAQILDSNMLNGMTGLTINNAGGGFGRWMDAKADDPSFQLAGCKYPVKNKGETSYWGQLENTFPTSTSVSISTSCKNPELAAKFLDFGYSEEGYMAYNFGIEGVSYEMIDGQPKFTDILLNNPDGWVLADALQMYCKNSGGGPFVQDYRGFEQSTRRDSQREAVISWGQTNTKDHLLPQLYFNEDEAKQLAKLSADINTLVNEKTVKFIIGDEKLENFDSFTAELDKLGIKDILAIYKTAFERYRKR